MNNYFKADCLQNIIFLQFLYRLKFNVGVSIYYIKERHISYTVSRVSYIIYTSRAAGPIFMIFVFLDSSSSRIANKDS